MERKMPFYNPDEIEPKKMPGRNRELIVKGENVLMMRIDRHEITPGGHSHPNEQIIYLLEGRARFRVGDEEHTAEPGHAVHIPPGVHHELELLTPTIRYIEVFSPPLDV
jgi:quercetin dioxygenase-like cupin family protein